VLIEQSAAADVRDLYRTYGHLVYAAAHCVLRRDELAEEATATTLVRASRAKERTAQDGDVHRWLATLATQAVADVSRRECDRSTMPIAAAASLEEVWDVRRAIDMLPSTEATVVRLEHRDGFTHSQIAARLGLPVATVTSTSHRAHSRLARTWREFRRL